MPIETKIDPRGRGPALRPLILFLGSLSLLFSGCALVAPAIQEGPSGQADRERTLEAFAPAPPNRLVPLLAAETNSPEPVPLREQEALSSEPEEGPGDEASIEKAYQDLIDQAIELCEESRRLWEGGNLDGAVEALDKAFSLIRRVGVDAPPDLAQQKDDLRFTISKRLVEIYGSRVTAVQAPHTAIPLALNSHVTEAIGFLSGRERRFFLEAYRQSGRYRPAMVSALEKAGLPEELSWLPLIESGFKTRALSRAGALGLWQFIPSTGYRYGLKRTRWVDERMDPEKSTQAAIAYLKELHQLFGDWTTALAAYNCGEGSVLKKIQSQRINYLDNFWDLYPSLPRETAQYVPRFLAVLHILSSPETYGLSLPEIEAPKEFETAEIDTRTSLKTVARCIGVDPQELTELNPELRYASTPDRSYALRVPKGSADSLIARLTEIPRRDRVEPEVLVHRVVKGDSLSHLAQSYRTSVRSIIDLNDLRNGHYLKVGWDLKIPTGRFGGREESLGEEADAFAHRAAKPYRVKRGDSLWKIADRFKTSTKELRELNRLPNADIREGQVLRIPAVTSVSVGIGKSRDQDV